MRVCDIDTCDYVNQFIFLSYYWCRRVSVVSGVCVCVGAS